MSGRPGIETAPDPTWFEEAATLEALRAAGVSADAVELCYRRVRADGSAVHSFEIRGRGPSAQPVELGAYVRVFADPARQAEVESKWSKLRARDTVFGAGMRRVGDGSALLLLFPNDLTLRDLFHVTNADKLKRLLADVPGLVGPTQRVRGRRLRATPMRYKPEHRYVARLDLQLRDDATKDTVSRSVFLRYFAEDRGHSLERIARVLYSSGFDRFPRSIGTMLDGKVHLEDAVDGSLLVESLREDARVAADVGRMIAALHRAAVPADRGGLQARERLRLRSDRAIRSLRRAGLLGPETDSGWLESLARLVDLPSPPSVDPVILHGDLHVDQVLVEGKGPVLVDFERCALGDPHDDIGNLIADVRSRDDDPRLKGFLRSFLDAYVEDTGELNDRRLAAYTAVAFMERAVMAIRRASTDAEDIARREIERACAEVERASRSIARSDSDRASRVDVDATARLPWPWAEAGSWDAVFPSRKGIWTVRFAECEGQQPYATFDHSVGALTFVEPENDPALPAVRDRMPGATVVAYRPGRRCVLRSSEGGTARWIKIVAPKRAAALDRRLRAVDQAASASGTAFPRHARVLERDIGQGVFVFDSLPGSSWYAITRSGFSKTSFANEAAAVVAALSGLQGRAATEAAEVAGIEHEEPGAAIADARRWCDYLKRIDEPIAAVASEALHHLTGRIEASSGAGEACLVHGDFHDKNILLDRNSTVGILDFDSVRLGDPGLDPGNLGAHLVLRDLQRAGDALAGRARLDSWLSMWSGGSSAIGERSRLFAGVALVRLAAVYRLRRRFTALASQLIDEARRIAETTR